MKLKNRSLVQIAFTIIVMAIVIIYYLYINEYIDYKIFSIGDLNPYGGWSALKSFFTDVSYRFRGISYSMALTVAISITAFLFGRIFCGYICPIGAMQDFFKFMGNRLGLKEIRLPRWRYFNFELIKYLILILVLVLSILGLGHIISPLSPWVSYLNIFMGLSLKAGTIVILAIAFLSLFIRRLFCRVFCPLGAFQALLSAIGPSPLEIGENCGRCIYCMRNCPVHIERPKEREISPECIRCVQCINTPCIRGNEGYRIRLGKIIMKVKAYVSISLVIFIVIFIILPILGPKGSGEAMAKIEGLNDGTFTGTALGFGGNIEVELVVENRQIKDIKVLSHSETTGYYEEVFRSLSRDIIERQNLSVDAISGATTTSRGFLNAVRRGISKSLEGN